MLPATTPWTGCVTQLWRKRGCGRVSASCPFLLTMCDSDERNMSHTSISAEDCKPAAGRFGPLHCNQKKKKSIFPLFPNTMSLSTLRIPSSQRVSVTVPITLVFFWISFVHKF